MSAYILIVDDEPDVRELFKITLGYAGYRINVAKDGLEAIGSIEEERPELIVLDLMMPHLDGFGVLSNLRENRSNGDESLKVIVATAKSLDDKDMAALSDWPVVGVLNKGELDIAKMVIDVRAALGQ